MVAGHYATALVAYERERTAPLWLLLFASIFLDLLMITLVLLGVETMAPPEGIKPSLAAMRVDMTFSHDVVPVLLWSAAIAGFAWWWTRRLAIAAWAAVLVLLHEIADFVSGFPHFVLGPGTREVGLGLYFRAPLLALAIELAVGLACVWWFCSRTDLPRGRRIALYALVIGGVAAMLPLAR